MQFWLIVLLILFLILGLSCTAGPPSWPKKDSSVSLKIIGDSVASEQKELIHNALSCLPENFRNSLRVVDINAKDVSHFIYYYDCQIRYGIGHHCLSRADGRQICVRPEYLNWPLIWHEIAHVFTAKMDKPKEFEEAWRRIAGDVYWPDYEKFIFDKPSDGVITQYSRRSYLEDIAEFVEESYRYLYLDNNYGTFKNENFKKDKRYLGKLDILYKYGFFDKKDHQELKKVFTP